MLSEDEWLESVYPNKIISFEDYIKYSNRLKSPIKKLVQSILDKGINVVMNFTVNTPSQREWFRLIYTEVEAPLELIYIDTPDEVCLKRIIKRSQEQPERVATDTAEMFEKVTKYFQEPLGEEGYHINKIKETA